LTEALSNRQFDYIVAIDLIDKRNCSWFLKYVYELLKPGGQFIFYESNPRNLYLKFKRLLSHVIGKENPRNLLNKSCLYELISEVGYIKIYAVYNDFVYTTLSRYLMWFLKDVSVMLENTPKIVNSKTYLKILIFIFVLVISLIPIWLFDHIPTQDGPSHLYNSYILRELFINNSNIINDIYEINFKLFPNWSSYLILAFFMSFVEPLIAEKILVSLIIVLLPLSIYYFLLNFYNKHFSFCLATIGFFFSYNFFLNMGFYNFCLSLPLMFFSLGYWFRFKGFIKIKQIPTFYILLFVTYLTHFISFCIVILFLTIYFTYYILSNLVNSYFEHKRNPDYLNLLTYIKTSRFSSEIRKYLLFIGYMLPLYLLLIIFSLNNAVGYEYRYADFDKLIFDLVSLKSIVYFRDIHSFLGHAILGIYLFGFIYSKYYCSDHSMNNNYRQTKKPKYDCILLLYFVILLLILYFTFPRKFISGPSFINVRFQIFALLFLIFFLANRFSSGLLNKITFIMLLITILRIGVTSFDYHYLSKEISEMRVGQELIKDNTTLTMIEAKWDGPEQRTSKYIGIVKYISPFLFVPAYYCINKGVVFLKNYEAELSYFPIKYRANYKNNTKYKMPDYIVIWRIKSSIDKFNLSKYYNKIYSSTNHEIYEIDYIN